MAIATFTDITQFEPLENEIIDALNEGLKTCFNLRGNGQWTSELLNRLRILGKSKNYSVCPDPEENQGAWLYDLIWYKENEKNNLSEIPLAVESEWSFLWSDVKYDFEKLLLSNSKYKLMICGFGNNNKKEWWENFENIMNGYQHITGESRFLIAMFDEVYEETFEFRVIVQAQSVAAGQS